METFGRYQLLRKLATGGMGAVYLARHRGPAGNALCVVKRILPHLAQEEEFIRMFFDEARIAGALAHPNVAQVFDLGEVSGQHYLAMEYVHGESLRRVNTQLNQRGKRLPVGLACRIVADAAAGLDSAHRARRIDGEPLGIVHRDVSPHNLLLGFDGAVKVIDFGVAKAAHRLSQTATGAIKGKYAYMSPEQARGDAVDARSDVFALGIVLFEQLTGARLFKRASDAETMKAVLTAEVPAPSSLQPALPPALDAIVLRALARDVRRRTPSAAALHAELEDVIAQEALPATAENLAAFLKALYTPEASDEASTQLEPEER